MALSGSLLAQELKAILAPWNGVQLDPFTQALGNGIVLALTGKLQFNTLDQGTIPGSGVGTGVGIKGTDPSKISSLMFTTGQGFWSSQQRDGPGVEWQLFCTKVSDAVSKHLKTNATLQSQHAPVFAGNGKVLAYSGVTADDMKGSIVAQSPSLWQQNRMLELAEAVATGVMTEVLSHTPADFVVIAGSPAGTPSGGSGSGSGIVL